MRGSSRVLDRSTMCGGSSAYSCDVDGTFSALCTRDRFQSTSHHSCTSPGDIMLHAGRTAQHQGGDCTALSTQLQRFIMR